MGFRATVGCAGGCGATEVAVEAESRSALRLWRDGGCGGGGVTIGVAVVERWRLRYGVDDLEKTQVAFRS
ncbi:hypothetical protein E3N88_30151 [Mikania micrantha]|uniref:Uncharacterized protein n=1 Tax=Mikania micrantha TaxID=192012 RepID=A0A5N6MLE2_9ASTR|nr:hypothetical protein E3N88_30151 [Mikania micrantha]